MAGFGSCSGVVGFGFCSGVVGFGFCSGVVGFGFCSGVVGFGFCSGFVGADVVGLVGAVVVGLGGAVVVGLGGAVVAGLGGAVVVGLGFVGAGSQTPAEVPCRVITTSSMMVRMIQTSEAMATASSEDVLTVDNLKTHKMLKINKEFC